MEAHGKPTLGVEGDYRLVVVTARARRRAKALACPASRAIGQVGDPAVQLGSRVGNAAGVHQQVEVAIALFRDRLIRWPPQSAGPTAYHKPSRLAPWSLTTQSRCGRLSESTAIADGDSGASAITG
jgi:hypothetical protein